MSPQFRILSIDGGGIRGIIPALVLAEIESRTGKPICELFDLIAGTSTGGIMALGLTRPKPDDPKQPQHSAKDLVRLYEKDGRRIFSTTLLHRIFSLGNILDQKYLSEPFEGVLAEFFGETLLSEALTPVLIPSYEIELRTAFFFKSENATGNTLKRGRQRRDYDFLMRDVARATSAAPTYFEPELAKPVSVLEEELGRRFSAFEPELARTDSAARTYLSPESSEREMKKEEGFALVDGGVYANNPAMCAVAEAICATKFDRRLQDIFMVSLGTGEQKRRLEYQDVKNWGVLNWAQPILSVVFHGVSDTVNYETDLILNAHGRGKRHYRLQVQLDERKGISLDDTRPAAIRALKDLAAKLIEERDGDIDDICQVLAPKPKRSGGKGVGQGRVAATRKRRAVAGKAGGAAVTRARTRKAAG